MHRTATLLAATVATMAIAVASAAAFVWMHRYVPPQDARRVYVHPVPAPDDLSWSSYGGDPGQTRHSRIRQITPDNVGHLQRAWVYRTGETIDRRGKWARQAKFEATPILAAGSLAFCTPFGRLIALDPGNGKERWVHDPQLKLPERLPGERFTCRGLALWVDAQAGEGNPCRERLFVATTDRRLIAVDARNGTPCQGFGDNGQVVVALDRPELDEWELQFTSAPAIVGDVVVVGSASGDNGRSFGPSGTVRAYDARTGSPRWTFEPVPRRFDPVASPTWQGDSAGTTGQANVWGSISVDNERDLVFLPTSSPSPDFYGGLRKGRNLYANSIVAVRGRTGQVAWHFQTVHHDLWDYDVPAGPSLITFRRNGARVPALVFATKSGFLFVLDRETGEPLTPVEEKPVPGSDVPGEWTSPTQPHSVGQPVIAPQRVSQADAFGLLLFDQWACRKAIGAAARNDGLFTPPSTGGTLMVPFSGGGANWGGVAVDPQRNRVFVNTSRAISRVTLLATEVAIRRRREESNKEISLMRGAPFGMLRETVLSPIGMPCNKPPWGALSAIDIEKGAMAWEVTLGNTRKVAPLGMAFDYGTPNFGGPIVTDGGVLFIAATMDNLLRAFDPESGRELWAGELPYGGQATPMTYSIGGRQYVVVAAGGHPALGIEVGDALVAFALPQ